MRTYQYRLFPTKSQQIKLWEHANKLNWLYNHFLNQRIENYKLGINICTDYCVEKNSTGKIGIDIGLKMLVVGSDGTKIKNRRDAKYFDL